MAFSPSDSRIFALVFGDPELAEVFSDEASVQQMLAVEAALARVQASLGLVPQAAAEAIQEAAQGLRVDWASLSQQTERDGVPVSGLLQQLQARVGAQHGNYLHWGATTQDILDTALVLQVGQALELLEGRLRRTLAYLGGLALAHRHTLMAGRTHSQQALPITFGLKVAGWMAPLLRHLERLRQLKPRLLVVQLGGAVGTLASLGESGIKVHEGLARELGLGIALLPWHTQRDSLAELASWLSLVTGSLGKLAQDLILLAQSEVGEVRESADSERGGSSTLPQKSNPVLSEAIIAVARANAALLASMHQALIQEHERATHGWQLEWLSLPQMLAYTGAALDKALFLSKNLVVEAGQMQENLRRSQGLLMAEALQFALAQHLDRAEAKKLVQQAVRQAQAEGTGLIEAAQQLTAAPIDWESLAEEHYLGSSQRFIENILAEAERILHE